MIINKSGILIRIAVDTLRVMGRATQGVRLINLRNNDEIAAVTKVSADIIETEDELLDENESLENEQIVEEQSSEQLTEENNSSKSLFLATRFSIAKRYFLSINISISLQCWLPYRMWNPNEKFLKKK